MRIMNNALATILHTQCFSNSTWWHGHEAGTIEMGTVRSGCPLGKLTKAAITFCVGVDSFKPVDKLRPPANFKYKLKALHRAGVRDIKFKFDRGIR